MTENVNSSPNGRDTQTGVLRQNWRKLGLHTYIKFGIIAVLFAYLFRNQIYNVVRRWSDPSWSHGFLIPLFSLYLINQHKQEILSVKTRTSYIGLILLICGIVFYPLNIVHFQYGYLNSMAMIGVLGAIVLFLGGWALLKYTWLPVGFLIFAIPLPQRYYVAITMPMRKWAAYISTVFMNLIEGMEATANGVIVDVVYKGVRLEPSLDVAEACSGMRLLMAFVALGVAMAYLHYRPFWQRLILLISTVPIAIFCNIVRVTITGLIYILGNPKYAQDIYHDMLGVVMLFLAFGIYWLLAWLMGNLYVEESAEPAEDVIVRKQD